MAQISLQTPLGMLTISEQNGKIDAVRWTDPVDEEETPLLHRAKEALLAYFDGANAPFDLPLAPIGSAFRQRVWTELRRIPYGTTISYANLAHRIGSGARAIGGACGANPIPILIPCHRVVSRHDSIGGYSAGQGVETKRALLRLEGASVPQP